ncbi:MAG TPA: histidinol dehydrogenase [Polyangiaceae bacterium]|jgi:histidinol dehydrogenase|nr:histidinol dehydrogenase [Polyangiaceae bacterium]
MTFFRITSAGSSEFDETVARLERRGETDLEKVEGAVREVLAAVKAEGDVAVRRYVERFESRRIERLVDTEYGGHAALESLSDPVREAMLEASKRIRRYHERQLEDLVSFEYEEDGIRLGSRVRAVSRVGVYVPGGKAKYPSSVLMSAIPASVAGVMHIVVATPSAGPEVRAACHLAGVHAILDAGGAQAIGALAYGTQSVKQVDKIVGPGNLYVAAAKRLVFGEVDIDSIAGPSEILVVADDGADARVVAADLLSQAEHDEAAYPLLVCTSVGFAETVARELETQLATLPRRAIAEASVRGQGAALVVASRDALAEVANRLAAEHVALHVSKPDELADRIDRAGALFVGDATPEAAGDYLAGPSHVLPTGGAARYGAPLGVYDFVSRTSIIRYERAALAAQAEKITAFARAEGLEAHARAVEVRSSVTERSR